MSQAPYALLSDVHAHAWSAFSHVLPNGMNSRLDIIIRELHRANAELKAAGGNQMMIAGDIFHVRGSIAPEVFNPVFQAFVEIGENGTEVQIIPGNHDLCGKTVTTLGNATQSLSEIKNVRVSTCAAVIHSKKVMIPWEPDLAKLRSKIADFQDKDADLIIHMGIDGVLKGMPDHGLSSSELASLSYKRIFAGHYHHHKIMENGKVVSIGATTHQTYSDIGTQAGFLLVYPDHVEYRSSHAPRFVEINETTDEAEIPLIVDGNYVRVRGLKITDQQIGELRKSLLDMNAKGVSIEVARDLVSSRSVSGASTAPKTITESINAYIDETVEDNALHIKSLCADVLLRATTVTA